MSEPEMNRKRIALETGCERKVESLHILPCHIKYSGPAPVSDYFQPTAIEVERSVAENQPADVQKEAYFRGRRLVGTEVEVPPDYVGYVYDTSRPSRTVPIRSAQQAGSSGTEASMNNRRSKREEDDEDVEEDEAMEELSEWQAKTRFDKVVVYGNASKVEDSDVVVKGIKEWFALASVIHGEVD